MRKNILVKQIVIYLVLSTLVVVFSQFAHTILIYIHSLFTFVHVKLAPFFNVVGFSLTTKRIILLVFIPVIIVAIPALIYRLIRGRPMPYFMECIWICWLIFLLSHLLIR